MLTLHIMPVMPFLSIYLPCITSPIANLSCTFGIKFWIKIDKLIKCILAKNVQSLSGTIINLISTNFSKFSLSLVTDITIGCYLLTVLASSDVYTFWEIFLANHYWLKSQYLDVENMHIYLLHASSFKNKYLRFLTTIF